MSQSYQPKVLGAPVIRRPLGPLRALLTGLGLGFSGTALVGYVWLARGQAEERREIAVALQELKDGASQHRATQERLKSLERSLVATREASDTKDAALTRARELRTLHAGLADEVVELKERLTQCETHLAQALQSSPVYLLAQARAEELAGRSWLQRTGGLNEGLVVQAPAPSTLSLRSVIDQLYGWAPGRLRVERKDTEAAKSAPSQKVSSTADPIRAASSDESRPAR
ncbi:hypothetical protein CBOM_05029 [Ceraceosorus bombacis]|uniref:Uncharacterized protein n=1 Tax=Ceraceosorus bombacis TaxID=401625 RepID=A0A0P1BI03_9BASI|nr:hypothetical protein CBOM_05029 [Ceraceosorus bombacis]